VSVPSRSDDPQFVLAADGRTRLHVTVTGSGPPLMLVHGWPLDQRIYSPQIPALSKAFTVIAWDRRGFGQSTGVPDLDADLADMGLLLDHLSLDSAHLLGMSQGGRLALRFAVLHPERVRSLVLQAPAVDGFRASCSEVTIPFDEYAALVREGRIDEMRAAWLDHPMMSAGIEDENTRRWLQAILAGYDGADLAGPDAGRPATTVDVAGNLGRLTMPVLLLTGLLETDARREQASYLLASLPKAREILFRDSGHLSNVTEAQRYNRAVLDFCLAVERDASGGSAEN